MAWATQITDEGLTMLNQAVGGNQIVFEGIQLRGYATNSNTGESSVYSVVPETFSVVQKNGYTVIKTEISNTEIRDKANNHTPLLAYLDNPIKFFEGKISARLQNQENSSVIFSTILPENEGDYISLLPTSSGTSTAKFEIPLAISDSASIQITTEDSTHVTQSQLDAAIATTPKLIGFLNNVCLGAQGWGSATIDGVKYYHQQIGWYGYNGTDHYPIIGLFVNDDSEQVPNIRYGVSEIAYCYPSGTGLLNIKFYAKEHPTTDIYGDVLLIAGR